MIRLRTSAAALLLLTLSGCKLGPNYKRPALDVPGQYRGAPNLAQQQLTGPSFAEMKWPSVYQDQVLQGLIKEALTNNYNVRIAAANIDAGQGHARDHAREPVSHPERKLQHDQTSAARNFRERRPSTPWA